MFKVAGTLNEPTPVVHASSPSQQLRSRSEVIMYNEDGVYGIFHNISMSRSSQKVIDANPNDQYIYKGYLLFPGGGIDDGETPIACAIRECHEEADRNPINIDAKTVVETIYDDDRIITKGWHGEKSHFFLALDGGESHFNHKDKEDFKVIPFDDAIWYLNQLINSKEELWAKKNNLVRKELVKEAKRLSNTKKNLMPRKLANMFYGT